MLSSKPIFLPLQPLALKIQKETSSRFPAAHEIRGLCGRLVTSLYFVPVCEKNTDLVKVGACAAKLCTLPVF